MATGGVQHPLMLRIMPLACIFMWWQTEPLALFCIADSMQIEGGEAHKDRTTMTPLGASCHE